MGHMRARRQPMATFVSFAALGCLRQGEGN